MTLRTRAARLAALFASAALAGCLPETQDSAQPAPQPSEELPNTAPTITGTIASSATAGTPWQFPFTVNDVDDDPLVVTATGLPAWASLDAQAHLVSGTPALTDVGTTGPIVLTVTDGQANSTLAAFTITVVAPPTMPPPQPAPEPDPEPQPQPEPVPIPVPPPPPPPPPSQPAPTNTAPTISGAPAITVQATRPYSFRPTAFDAQTPQSLSFSITNKPAWASFSTSTGTLSGTPSASQVGTYGNIRIRVTDGALSASLPAFSITVTAAPNRAPEISGSPSATSIVAGTAWSFRPTASDPDGQRLSFSIANKPAWATFSTATGTLSGTPTDNHAGTTANIVITVTDPSGASASLAAFSLTVTSPPRTGSAELSWVPPSEYVDSTALPPTEIAAYRIYHGTQSTNLGRLAEVDSMTRSFTVTELTSGTHYFAVTTVTFAGVESALSAIGSKSIP